jgi:hypothetical protein
MHAVYNYCGFVDIAEALSKQLRASTRPDSGACKQASGGASHPPDGHDRQPSAPQANKR